MSILASQLTAGFIVGASGAAASIGGREAEKVQNQVEWALKLLEKLAESGQSNRQHGNAQRARAARQRVSVLNLAKSRAGSVASRYAGVGERNSAIRSAGRDSGGRGGRGSGGRGGRGGNGRNRGGRTAGRAAGVGRGSRAVRIAVRVVFRV